MNPDGFKIDLVRNPTTGSAAYCCVITLIFIFNTIFETEISEKNPWHQNTLVHVNKATPFFKISLHRNKAKPFKSLIFSF